MSFSFLTFNHFLLFFLGAGWDSPWAPANGACYAQPKLSPHKSTINLQRSFPTSSQRRRLLSPSSTPRSRILHETKSVCQRPTWEH